MKIEWVNHASYVVRSKTIHLITDPWLFGAVFNNGWDLLSETRFAIEDFSTVTHIWLSHEHPDHFSPPVLKAIPQAIREKLVVIYQKTRDRKVLDYCEQLGFKTKTLIPFKWMELATDFRVLCGTSFFVDSWLLVENEGKKILNLNDCVIDTQPKAKAIFRKTGIVDVLLSQFSYASWISNAEELEARKKAGDARLQRLALQISTFRPTFIIPFASFVYFSHAENQFLNNGANHVDRVYAFLSGLHSAQPVVLYPGEGWTVGDAHDNGGSLERYNSDYLQQKVLHNSQSVPLHELESLATQYCLRLRKKNSPWLLKLMGSRLVGLFKPIRIRLNDLEIAVEFDLDKGLRLAELGSSGPIPAIELHSESLAYLLRFEWGFDTLRVNGRFRANRPEYGAAVRTLSVAVLNNAGRSVRPALVLNPRLIGLGISKLMRSRELSHAQVFTVPKTR